MTNAATDDDIAGSVPVPALMFALNKGLGALTRDVAALARRMDADAEAARERDAAREAELDAAELVALDLLAAKEGLPDRMALINSLCRRALASADLQEIVGDVSHRAQRLNGTHHGERRGPS